MLHFQVRPDVSAEVSHASDVSDHLAAQRATGEIAGTRHQLDRVPEDFRVLSGIQSIVPAVVYLPNKLSTPPSLAVADADALNSEFLHSKLKSEVRSAQKNRLFRNSPVTPGMIADDGKGRHLFLDDDDENIEKYRTQEVHEAFARLYGIDHVHTGEEFGESGLSLVGLVRVISGSREKARIKGESEDALVDRFLLDTFAALARNGKSSDVYARLVQENSKYRQAMKIHPAANRYTR